MINLNVEDCIFCQIINRKIPARIIHENEVLLAILDIFPISEGHTIVIPKEHYATLKDVPNNILGIIFNNVKEICELIYNRLEIDGYNILQNNFEAAGQVIKHFHVHIIPRIRNDRKLTINVPKKQATDEELDILLEQLRAN